MADSIRKTLLIIDDDKLFCDVMRDYLTSGEMQVFTANTGKEGLDTFLRGNVDVVLLDQNLPDLEGHTLCPALLEHNEQTKIIFITAHPSFEGAVKAIRAGAFDYISKPFELEELSMTVASAFKTLALEKVALVEDYKSRKESEDAVIVGSSYALKEILRLVDLAASTNAPVIITGETGTGKNVIAKSIHFHSAARKNAFISINCAALPENLIEAELFGYEKGAFTGAVASKRGIFEMAEDGTLFLDEIGEMPIHLQTKLLSALEDKKIKRLGGDSIRPVNVRIIAATCLDLEDGMGKTFRNDLYYRLSVVRIHIPPLRERREDIPELCSYLLKKIGGGRDFRIDETDLRKLMDYDWPGNVRELKNIIERATILQKGPLIRPSELLLKACGPVQTAPAPDIIGSNGDIIPLEDMEKAHISRALQKLSGNYTQSAKALGISLSTLKRKVGEYGLKKYA